MPVINRGDDYFSVVTYTGNGTSQTISGLRFQPDFVWIKGRSGATDHALYDAQRGVQNRLESNTTDAAVSSDNGVTAFNADGFSLGSLAQVNTNGATYVAWCWKEGATQGFDIVTYTGTGAARTISHSLGVAPKMMIVKDRSTTTDWRVYHSSINGGVSPQNYILKLNTTGAQATDSSIWNNTAPTSSVFSIGTNVEVNANGNNYVAYLFSEVAGFSKAFSYTGNGSADGPFIFTGFRPRFILIKESTPNARGWRIFDTARSPSNQAGLTLSPNAADAEDSGSGLYNQMDILSNGFKLRAGTNSEPTNESGATYIGFAWAEVPFKNSLAR